MFNKIHFQICFVVLIINVDEILSEFRINFQKMENIMEIEGLVAFFRAINMYSIFRNRINYSLLQDSIHYFSRLLGITLKVEKSDRS